MAEHTDLVAEISHVEKMSTQERLKHAKKRRTQQLKRWQQYEKHLEKESIKKRKSYSASDDHGSKKCKNTNVAFISCVMLLEGAARNDLEEVRQLLDEGVSPDVSNEDGLTALHQCCIDDNESMLCLLIEYQANVNARDSESWTPLHAAATCGHVHLCKILIDSGAELLAVNADGNMPYDICEDDTTLDFVESEMAKRGVTQDEIDSTRDESEKQFLEDLKELAANKSTLEYKDSVHGATPLHIAAANGYLEVGEFLLEKHVAVDARDEDSWQPIHAAACWLQPEMLELLVKYGANIDAKTRNGETPFDICEEPDLKQKILDLKDAIETKEATRKKEIENMRRRSHSRRSSLYSSNTSISETHLLSASIRRSSMREKNLLSLKDAKEEAARFSVGIRDRDEDEDEDSSETDTQVPATNIDDISTSTDINQNNPAVASKPVKQHISKEAGIVRKPTQHSIEFADDNYEREDPDNDAEINPDRKGVSPMVQRERRVIMGRMKDVLPPVAITNSVDNADRKDPADETRTSVRAVNEHWSSVHVTNENKPPGASANEPRSSEQSEKPNTTPSTNDNSVINSTAKEKLDSSSKENSPTNEPNAVTKPTPMPRVPPTVSSKHGTLAELKKQRSEKYNSLRLKEDVDEKLDNMYKNYDEDAEVEKTNVRPTQNNAHKPLAPAAPHKQGAKNGHNNATFVHSPNSPMVKFSAPASSPVVGSPRKNECCVIL